jgi:hypothetical protein
MPSRKPPRIWTPAEDQRLKEAVATVGLARFAWREIAALVDSNKDESGCYQRWFRTLRPDILRKEWSVNEVLHLVLGICCFGNKRWTKVCKLLPGRTDAHVRAKWISIMRASSKPAKHSCVIAEQPTANVTEEAEASQEARLDCARLVELSKGGQGGCILALLEMGLQPLTSHAEALVTRIVERGEGKASTTDYSSQSPNSSNVSECADASCWDPMLELETDPRLHDFHHAFFSFVSLDPQEFES